ncbi:DHS-like NAD/FAD-binding domain-containing protein [Gorgonomyces haynaldii]|nr:DHS-like NAD/FAD-binding domain-containing protein [Gorgonomyces haynaldii]
MDMGNIAVTETLKRETSANIIQSHGLSSFCDYLKANKCKNIIVMTGAGISTSAGIPDFRTKGTGLYDNLQKYNLPYPEAIFDIQYFKRKPEPFYTLAKELYPGSFEPTPSHRFIKLLEDKQLLLRNYTQNIDMLERLAGISDDLLVEAHGTFHTAKCVGPKSDEDEDVDIPILGCGKTFEDKDIKQKILDGQVPECPDCKGLVKPDIVFFGEQLPERFHSMIHKDFKQCDALIVIGTSLSVAPFSGLIHLVKDNVPRLLINREVCGTQDFMGRGFDFECEERIRDALFLGTCDEGVLQFQEEMGWQDDDLSQLLQKTKIS